MSKLQITWSIASSLFQIVIGYLCKDIISMINLHFMGRYADKFQTGACGLVQLLISLCFVPIGLGINQTLNHQVSHALGQNKQKLPQIYFNFTFYTLIILSLPLYLLINSQWLFQLFTQEKQILENISIYILPIFISELILLVTECLKQYLVAHQVFEPFPYIFGSTVIFHYLICQFFFGILQLGYVAVCISIILSQIFTLILLIIYIFNKPEVKKAFKDVDLNCQIFKYKQIYILYLKESIPLILHIQTSAGIVYLLLILAYKLGVDLANAQLAFSNTSKIFIRFPLSLSITLMSFVGNSLSQHDIQKAKQYIISAITVYLLILLLLMAYLTIFSREWASIYTEDQNILIIMQETLPYFIMGSIFFDGFQGTLSGALKGANMQSLVSNSTIIAYYIFGVPLILILTYSFDLQLKGIWLGFGISNMYLTVYFMYYLYHTNWELQADQIRHKTQELENCVDNLELPILK